MAVVDFTTYTETDPSSKLTVTSTKVDVAAQPNTTTANVYKDYGADYFNGLDTDFEAYINSSSSNGHRVGPAFVNSGSPAAEYCETLTSPDLHTFLYVYNASCRAYLFRGYGTALDSYDLLSKDTLYYFTISRTADNDTVNVYVYSDSGRTSLIDTITVAGFGTTSKWQYQYGYLNYKADAGSTTGYVQNLDLNAGASGPSNLKSLDTNLKANIKSYNTNLIANVKSINTNV